MTSRAMQVVEALRAGLGPQRWWPAEGPFEVCVGAMLAQNTAWTNVEKAMAQLKAALGVRGTGRPYSAADGVEAAIAAERAAGFTAERVLALGDAGLEAAIKPAGTFRVKGKRLRRFCKWVVEEHGGDLARPFALGPDSLREALLEINGIGPETADAIALYAAGKETFVADSYTHRILARHGWLDWESGYDEVRGWFMDGLPRDAALFNEAHALIVRAGKDFCKSKPKCDGCPLKPMLPGGGVRERESW